MRGRLNWPSRVKGIQARFKLAGWRQEPKLNACILFQFFVLAFGPFIRMFGAENILHRQNSLDAAKTQSWMKPLEFTRIAFSNEIKHTGIAPKFDGELLKRMCSNGDTIELRTNFKDEIQIRLQTTFVLAFNNGSTSQPLLKASTKVVCNCLLYTSPSPRD